jgi:hypothetical protein
MGLAPISANGKPSFKGRPLENPFFFSLSAEGGKREKEEKMYLGTPRAPAGEDPCTPLVRAVP